MYQSDTVELSRMSEYGMHEAPSLSSCTLNRRTASCSVECRLHQSTSLFRLTTITPEDQSVLFSCARSIGATLSVDCFDEVIEGTAW